MGVRALEPALGSAGLNGVNPTRQFVFRIVDVLLTGVVIAGGSDAIHKLVSVFTNGLDQINGNLERNTPALQSQGAGRINESRGSTGLLEE